METITVTYLELDKRVKKKIALDPDGITVWVGPPHPTSLVDGEEYPAHVEDITVHNFSVWARGTCLLKNASLKISHAGKRYGLVGPDANGNSIPLKLLASRRIPVPKHTDVLLVQQEDVIGDDRTAIQALVSSANADSVAEFVASGSAEALASKILAGLGFTTAMQNQATRSLSGPWRMRISLARALLLQPTFLLLDEPTKHLDLPSILWLGEYLRRWNKTLVVISNDPHFLNTVCNHIIHLHGLKLHSYPVNYCDFERDEQRHKQMNNMYGKRTRPATRPGNQKQQDIVEDRLIKLQVAEARRKTGYMRI